MKMRVRSDRDEEYKKEYGDYGDCIPVDLYGKRVWKTKADSYFREAAEDIKEFYDLEGDAGLS